MFIYDLAEQRDSSVKMEMMNDVISPVIGAVKRNFINEDDENQREKLDMYKIVTLQGKQNTDAAIARDGGNKSLRIPMFFEQGKGAQKNVDPSQPVLFKLHCWNPDFLRFPVKLGFQTPEGIWTSEQRGFQAYIQGIPPLLTPPFSLPHFELILPTKSAISH